MNKNLKTIIIFSIVLFGLLYTFSFLLDYGVKHSANDQTGKVNLIMNHKLDKEIIIFGSSVGEAGVNAQIIKDITGFDTYNAAIDGTRFMQYQGLVNEYNNYSKKCKYVILAETFFTFEKINAVTSIERYLAFINQPNIYKPLYEMQPELAWKCRYIPFYKFIPITHNYYKNSLNGWFNIIKQKQPEDKFSGFVPQYKNWTADQDSLNFNAKTIEIRIDSEIVKKYGQMLAALKQKGRKVIIVLPPIQKDAWKLLKDLDKLKSTLHSFENENVFFLDYSDSQISFNKDYFYNNMHLNNAGAELFSKSLAAKLHSF